MLAGHGVGPERGRAELRLLQQEPAFAAARAHAPQPRSRRASSGTFAALASTTRRAILARPAEGAATVDELAEPFALTLPALSKHIQVLEQAGLIVRGRHAQYRPCALDAAPLHDVATWAERYRPVWEARLDRMADRLVQLHPPTGRPPR
ncbi:MAG TPA: metalloregulator ArsR/SmtB family transcription factor [Acidimicrobiales bacterium]|nr:metalloregulator ArsR/SmtB family transcription factor [Acidimicrobiales bacterium]